LPLLTPVTAVQVAVLNGFGEVLGGDVRRVREVGNGARHAQYAVMRASREVHLADRELKRSLARIIQRANHAQLRRRQPRIVSATLALLLARRLDAFANLSGAHLIRFPTQLFVRHSRHFDMHIDAIEKWAAHFGQIALDHRRRAAAFARGVAMKPTGLRLTVLTDKFGLHQGGA
jgi:hypothetical protein